MQFTKPMIELVYEIRRLVPSDMKPAIKLANPELFSDLQHHYHHGANAVNKALIKELFHLAGAPWPARLENPAAPVSSQTIKVYRGQVQAEDRPLVGDKNSTQKDAQEKQRKKRIYRGRVIEY